METIRICDRTVPVAAQRHAYLRHNLSGADLQKVVSGSYASESYRLLCVLIPPLKDIPLWQWEGYGSQEAMDAGDYKEADDRSPTTDEIAAAFETALKVNGAGRVAKLFNVVQQVQQMGQDAASAGAGEVDPTSQGSPGSTGD